jgi:tetratricopeptide (TPR) repeat protein
MDSTADIHLDVLRPNEFAIFCGAGISRNSGLPLAYELVDKILECLRVSSDDIALFKKAGYPFEAFMEILSKNSDLSLVLDIFSLGRPNTNHILIAKLAKLGYIKNIFTTNFDLLFEAALDTEDLLENIHYNRYCEESDFRIQSTPNIMFCKIHGSIDNIDTIRTTIQAIANHTLSERRGNALSYLFSSGEHRKVIVLGYSCSDFFDIIPEILRIDKGHKEILLVQHDDNKKEMEQWTTIKHGEPFSAFPGITLVCDTDSFIKHIWDSVYKEDPRIGDYIFSRYNENWKDRLIAWEQTISSLRDFISGHLFSQTNFYETSKVFWMKAFDIAVERNDLESQAQCFLNLGNDCNKLGNIQEAIKNHKEALKIFDALHDKHFVAISHESIGNDYARLGEYEESIRHFQKSYREAVESDNEEMRSSILINLANSYLHIEKFDESKKCLKEASSMTKKHGCLSLVSDCYSNMGNMSLGTDDDEKAIHYFEESLKIDKRLGNKLGQAECHGNIGIAYFKLGSIKEAIDNFEISLSINYEIGNKAVAGTAYFYLGIIWTHKHNLQMALAYFSRAEQCYMAAKRIKELCYVFTYMIKLYHLTGNEPLEREYRAKMGKIKDELGKERNKSDNKNNKV